MKNITRGVTCIETVHYYRMSLSFFLENAEKVNKEEGEQ
jgi:hypothetical protein